VPRGRSNGPPSVREPAQPLHDIPSKEDGAFIGFVQHALLVEPLEYPNVRGVKHGGVRVPEDGDELVCVDLRFDRAERRVAALVCERGAYLHETDITVHLRERELSWTHGNR